MRKTTALKTAEEIEGKILHIKVDALLDLAILLAKEAKVEKKAEKILDAAIERINKVCQGLD